MKVLLVDDNFPFPEVFQRLLAMEGVTLEHCTDPEHALQVARTSCPDLVIIEENLGSVSGLLLFRLMKLDARVIVTSIVPPDSTLQAELDDLGVNEFILKPFAHYQVIPRVLRLLEQSQTQEWYQQAA
jgi:DNA-binding response OmpR family regulator